MLQRIWQLDAQRGGNQFGDAIHFGVRNIHGAANIFHRRLGRHGAEGDDLRNIFAAVFLRDVINHFAAAPHAEINIDIRHGDALGIQEALKNQVVLQRIDVRDAQRVAHQAAGRRTAARAHRNALPARVMNEIPHDQEVAFVAHLLDHLDLKRQAALVFGQAVSQQTLFGEALQVRNARGKTFAHHHFEITSGRVAVRNLEFRKWIGDALDLYVAARGNIHGAAQRFGQFTKYLRHFRGGLEIKLVSGKFHAMRIAHGLAGLDAQQNFLGVRVGVFQVVAIVGGHQRNAGFFRETHEVRIDGPLDIQALVLNL